MQAWLAQLLARLIATLARLRARLETPAVDPEAPPPHWLAHVAARSPHLVQGGRVQATFASLETTAPAPAPAASPPPSAPQHRRAALPREAAWLPAELPPASTIGPRPTSAPPRFAAAGAPGLPSSVPPAAPTPPPALEIERGAGLVEWPRLDAGEPPAMPFPPAPEPVAGIAPTAWPDLPPRPEAQAVAPDDLDPLLENDLRRLERSLREMEGLPWIG